MPKGDSSINMLILAAIVAVGIGYYLPPTLSGRTTEMAKAAEVPAKSKAAAASDKAMWTASAPGRVEPAGGEVRISAQAPGRIAEVAVAVNDKVVAGDLLARLDDDELIGRVNAALADVAFKKRDRDATEVTGKASERRSAEDSVAVAERQLVAARDEFDRTSKARRTAGATDADLDKARDAMAKAKDKVDQARATLRRVQATEGLPAPTRAETILAAARADLSAADAALERTRIRAPSQGTVLQLNAKAGELASPSPENVLFVIGDLSALRVRAEFEERDMGKLRTGQVAVVRSDAFPGKDFGGKVTSQAQALAPSRLGQRGPRKPTDVDVLEVMIDLDGQPPLLPGMRVDVFIRSSAAAAPGASASSAAAGTRAN